MSTLPLASVVAVTTALFLLLGCSDEDAEQSVTCAVLDNLYYRAVEMDPDPYTEGLIRGTYLAHCDGVPSEPSPIETAPPPRSCADAADITGQSDYIYGRLEYHAENGADPSVLEDDRFLFQALEAAQEYERSHCR